MTPSVVVAICGLTFAAIVQAIAFVVWLTRLDMRTKALENSMKELSGVGERLARIEGDVHHIRNELAKLTWLTSPAAPGRKPPRTP